MNNGLLDNIEETPDPMRIDRAWEQIYNLLRPRRIGKSIGQREKVQAPGSYR
jgi:hypothetical protein